MLSSHETSSTTSRTSMDLGACSNKNVRFCGPEIESSSGFQGEKSSQPACYTSANYWTTLMTGFEPPVAQDPGSKQRPGRFFLLTCLVSLALVLATAQYNPLQTLNLHQLPQVLSRSVFAETDSTRSLTEDEVEPSQLSASSQTPDVQFDNFSLILKGQRVFL